MIIVTPPPLYAQSGKIDFPTFPAVLIIVYPLLFKLIHLSQQIHHVVFGKLPDIIMQIIIARKTGATTFSHLAKNIYIFCNARALLDSLSLVQCKKKNYCRRLRNHSIRIFKDMVVYAWLHQALFHECIQGIQSCNLYFKSQFSKSVN